MFDGDLLPLIIAAIRTVNRLPSVKSMRNYVVVSYHAITSHVKELQKKMQRHPDTPTPPNLSSITR